MLRVSATSWHYRLYKWTQRYGNWPNSEPKSLCSYFWSIVLTPLFIYSATFRKVVESVLFRPFVWLGRLNQTALIIVVTAVITTVIVCWGFLWPHKLLIAAIVVVGIIVAGVLLLLIALGIAELSDRRKSGSDLEPITGQLIFEFVRAKKRRVCPLIEVVDEPRESVLH